MKGIIYKIYDNTNGNLYYGSTTQKLSQRIARHRASYKNGTNRCSSVEILKNGDYAYSLVEEVEFESKLILQQRERYYIENFECVNKRIPSRTSQEHKEYDKHYREANKDKIKDYDKQYNEANKDKIKEYNKQYREANKANIKCECGCEVSKANINRHIKTKKHIRLFQPNDIFG